MDLNYYSTFYNLPHKERLLLILMNSYKSELNACKNKTTQIYISKIYDDHIKILLSSDSVKTSTPSNKIQNIYKNIPKPSISNITLRDLINNESHQIIDDNSTQIIDDNSTQIIDDNSKKITNKYLSNIDDILNEFDIKYGAWEQEEDDMF
jgi:hypothetical protein